MPTVQVRAQLSTDDLMQAAEQLSTSELKGFLWKVVSMHALRKARSLPKNESELLLKINRPIPRGIQERYEELIAKRKSGILSELEYNELLKLTDQVENLEAKRLGYLKELALIRNTSLTELMEELEIQRPAYD